MMNPSGSYDFIAHIPVFPFLRDLPAYRLENIQQRLQEIRNCCEHCRPLWGQWQKVADSLLQKASGKAASGEHPCRPITIGLECTRAISQRMVTVQDKTALTARGLDIQAALPVQDNMLITCLVDLRRNKKAVAAGDELAAAHYYASKAMEGILESMLKYRLKEAMLAIRRGYDPAANRLFPLRDVRGAQVDISFINNLSLVADSGRRYAATDIKPFVAPGLSGDDRQRLYTTLLCRKLTQSELPPHEIALIGQWGVIANQDLPAARCIGIFSGTLVSSKEMGDGELFSHDYIIDISVKSQPTTYLDSDGILSKINTIYAYNEEGKPVCQGELGYNVEIARFKTHLTDGRKINLVAIFTTEFISAGRELRLNYHYSRDQIASLPPPPPSLYPPSPRRLKAQ
ncbi:hypothetical protein [Martelella alba]|uniref:SET domain-containing protein n=1 Tax=Martelella alba TaxID=2590451 RepID=A0ABY2SNR6_9HYPH|nr:hypothetical protein [Martelella alba]TKI07174.1 hypothetical protein FCN80_07020 [Martelella alba]